MGGVTALIFLTKRAVLSAAAPTPARPMLRAKVLRLRVRAFRQMEEMLRCVIFRILRLNCCGWGVAAITSACFFSRW
jgi:hypothetical protein